MSGAYYVYGHLNPATGEVVYIGSGQHGRAFDFDWKGGRRKAEHVQYLSPFLETVGCDLNEIVKVYLRGLSHDSARRIERELIASWQPRFNMVGTGNAPAPLRRVSPEEKAEIIRLREQGMPCAKIAGIIGRPHTTVSRVIQDSGRVDLRLQAVPNRAANDNTPTIRNDPRQLELIA